jgi:hypothetical protein
MTKMIATCAVSALALAACAGEPQPGYSSGYSSEGGGLTAAQQATIDQLHREIDARHQPWRTEMEITEQELAMFKREPLGSCQSPHLARASQVSSEDALAKAAGAYDNALYESAELTLEVADAAAGAACPEQARSLYREVIRTFIGSGYAAYRQRAEIGLEDLRG